MTFTLNLDHISLNWASNRLPPSAESTGMVGTATSTSRQATWWWWWYWTGCVMSCSQPSKPRLTTNMAHHIFSKLVWRLSLWHHHQITMLYTQTLNPSMPLKRPSVKCIYFYYSYVMPYCIKQDWLVECIIKLKATTYGQRCWLTEVLCLLAPTTHRYIWPTLAGNVGPPMYQRL